MEPPFAVATSTWNSDDLIERWLVHYERMGASAIFVADLGSTDGTLEILDSARWRELVHRHPLESPLEADPHNELLEVARSALGDGWCLFCDPDEFLVTPNMTLQDICADGSAYVLLPLHNVTARPVGRRGRR